MKSFEIIAQRSFSQPDLQWFAAASGDWNPIHVDPVAARRLLPGAAVVHGMYTLLWALDAYCAAGAAGISAITAHFSRPVLIGDQLALVREPAEQDAVRLTLLRGEEIVATILLSTGGGVNNAAPVPVQPARARPEVHSFSDLKNATGHLPVMALPDDVQQAFPSASTALGAMPVAALMGLSRLVGMQCPGLHSLFAGVDVRLDPSDSAQEINWQVSRHTVPQAPLRIALNGGGIAGRIDAFVRPEPVAQPSMMEVAASVTPGSFSGQVALVVGGSRGLGELTAKTVAAGGGQVIVTYASGRPDAERVAQEITAWGGACRILEMDVELPGAAIASLMQCAAKPTHLYYFAAPRIGKSKSGVFDQDLYQTFNRLFVEAFAAIVTALAKELPAGLRVFYPSSVFLDELSQEYAEYIAAKTAGEAMCRQLAHDIPGLQVMVRRLPRLPTDQTAGLIRRAVAAPLPEIVRVVDEMHSIRTGNTNMNINQHELTSAWDSSYSRRENYVFFPCDEMVRFVARTLRRRVGLDEVIDVLPGAAGSKVIDVGCGIGRNLVFGTEMGLDMYGNDLSEKAVALARDWLGRKIGPAAKEHVIASDIRTLPWPDKFFAHAISDSALDSMPFEIAQSGVAEIARIVQPGGYFYCNLISGDETGREPDFCGEVVVHDTHERDTVQSYFNRVKIRRLLEPMFEILSCQLHQVSDPVAGTRHGRWHVVSRRR